MLQYLYNWFVSSFILNLISVALWFKNCSPFRVEEVLWVPIGWILIINKHNFYSKPIGLKKSVVTTIILLF